LKNSNLKASSAMWQPFYLTKSKDIDDLYNQNCLSISDLFEFENQNKINNICIMNFMIDMDWLIDECPILMCVPLICLHGSEIDSNIKLDNIQISKVKSFIK
jgi:hypothetical protein